MAGSSDMQINQNARSHKIFRKFHNLFTPKININTDWISEITEEEYASRWILTEKPDGK